MKVLLKRREAPAPTEIPREEAERLGRAPADEAFLTGNGFAARCRYVVNYAGPVVNEDVRNDWWFCKGDHLEWFFQQDLPQGSYVLLSHNSDYPVDERFRRWLRSRRLRAWFAANVALRHSKLIPIPLGIANPAWPHGDTTALRAAQAANVPKTRLFDVSFSLETNVEVRRHCLEQIGLAADPPLGHAAYLRRLASAHFCIAPRGYGLDTHRVWEALYLGTVPVVTRSPLTDEYADLPLVVLDDWRDFHTVDFSPDLHERLMDSWSPSSLSMDSLLARLAGRLTGSS